MVSIGTLGDVNPFISLGQALQRRGHRITFLAPAVHEELVREAGFAFHALGSREDYFALINNPDLWDSRKAFETLWRGVLSILVEIPTFVRALPADEQCLLLTHPFALPAASLARAERPDLPIVWRLSGAGEYANPPRSSDDRANWYSCVAADELASLDLERH